MHSPQTTQIELMNHSKKKKGSIEEEVERTGDQGLRRRWAGGERLWRGCPSSDGQEEVDAIDGLRGRSNTFARPVRVKPWSGLHSSPSVWFCQYDFKRAIITVLIIKEVLDKNIF